MDFSYNVGFDAIISFVFLLKTRPLRKRYKEFVTDVYDSFLKFLCVTRNICEYNKNLDHCSTTIEYHAYFVYVNVGESVAGCRV